MLVLYLLYFLEIFCPRESSGNRRNAEPDSLSTEKVYLHTDRDIYSPGDDIWFSAYLVDGLTHMLSDHSFNLHIELISPDSKITGSRIIKLAGGLGNGDFHLNDNLVSGNYQIRCYTNYMRNFGEEFFFRKTLKIINRGDAENALSGEMVNNSSLFASYFPEGGSLVENVPSVIAFKVEDTVGNAINVKGKIFNDDGEFCGSFESKVRGMGYIYFTPRTGQKYYAVITDSFGDETRTDFPASFQKGVVLNIVNKGDGLHIFTRTNPQTLRLISETDLQLSVFSRGVLFKTVSFRMNSNNGHLLVPAADIPDGIAAVRLTGPSGLPLCERLVYIENSSSPVVEIKTDEQAYRTRDSVEIKISLRDSTHLSSAYMSFSAAEESSFTNNVSPSTISSWFLLESEVKGSVADPGYYFDRSNPDRLKDLDLLLLTQGWRDFKWKYDEMKFSPEYGFSVSGNVRKKFANDPLKDVVVNIGVFSAGMPLIRMVPVDSSGIFSLENLYLSGMTKIVASITDGNDKFRGVLNMDSLSYVPESVEPFAARLPGTIRDEQDSTSNDINKNIVSYINSTDYRLSLKRNYKLSDTITPGEVIVRSTRQDAPESPRARSRRYLMATPDKEMVITPVLEIYSNTYDLINKRVITPFPASPSPNKVYNPLYLIDGAFASTEDVKALSLKWVERIDILSNENSYTQFKYHMLGETVRQGSFASNEGASNRWDKVIFQKKDSEGGKRYGVISIILKSDAEIERVSPSHSVNLKIKGYDVPRVFYSPRHTTSLQKDYKPDLRTTLFWKPDINIAGDSVAVLKYFNADNSSKIRLTVEGISSKGIPVTGHAEYVVK